MKGQPIIDYMKGKGAEWLGLLVIQLLGDLEHLHREGWAFGDLSNKYSDKACTCLYYRWYYYELCTYDGDCRSWTKLYIDDDFYAKRSISYF